MNAYSQGQWEYYYSSSYLDYILLPKNDIVYSMKLSRLPKIYEMKAMGEASFGLSIEIHNDRSRHMLG